MAGHLSRPGIALTRLRLPVVFACAAGLGLLAARGDPYIDVWTFQQGAAAALLRGDNPYAVAYPNIYRSLAPYGAGVADLERVHSFPYPPQTVLAGLPFFAALGDVRYGSVVALLVAGLAVARLAPRGLATPAAAALLLHPQNGKVIHAAWTEPWVLALVLLLALALRRSGRLAPGGWVMAGLAGAAAAGSKQYSPLLLLPLVPALPRPGRLRAVALALLVTAAVLAAFASWDARGLWEGVAAMQVRQPFRLDSLSWQVAVAKLGGRFPQWLGFALAAGALALTWPRPGARGAGGEGGARLGRGLLCAAAAFLVFVVTAKQAFANYYWLADGLLLALPLLLAPARPPGEA
jgi:hypothetical protein